MPSERRLKTQENCRSAIAWIFRELEKDRMDAGKARVLIYAALSISGILSEHDLEKRVEALETNLPNLKRTA
jgi:hypothetical protein